MPGRSARPSAAAPTVWAAGLSSSAVVVMGVLGALALAGTPAPSGPDAVAAWRPGPVEVVVPAAALAVSPGDGQTGPGDRPESELEPPAEIVDDRRELVLRRALPPAVLSVRVDAAPRLPRVEPGHVAELPEVRPGDVPPSRPGPPPHADTRGRPAHAGTQGPPPHARAKDRPLRAAAKPGAKPAKAKPAVTHPRRPSEPGRAGAEPQQAGREPAAATPSARVKAVRGGGSGKGAPGRDR